MKTLLYRGGLYYDDICVLARKKSSQIKIPPTPFFKLSISHIFCWTRGRVNGRSGFLLGDTRLGDSTEHI
jgi:hypothetical protein